MSLADVAGAMEAYAPVALLGLAAPFTLWAAWCDVRTMRIPNEISVYAGLVFILAMPFFLSFESYGFRVAVGGWVLVAGFILNALGLLGGGDAKFATVMAPFVTPGQYIYLLMAYLASILVCFVFLRLLQFVAQRRGILQDWKSFSAGRKFPMGLPIAVTMLVYLGANAVGVIPGGRL